jgi:hypothetical protein
MEHYESRELDDAGSRGNSKQRNNQTKPQGDPRSESVKIMRESLSSPSSWGYESPSQLNREVTSILSKGNPPETARSQFTHPDHGSLMLPPHDVTSRSSSCPLYQNTKLWGTGSPFQSPDQSAELRNHLYQAALNQNTSPFTPLRYPFLPPNRGFFPSFPPGVDISRLRQPFRPPFPSMAPFPRAGSRSSARESPLLTQAKRKYSTDVPSSSQVQSMHQPQQQNLETHPTQAIQSSTYTSTATAQPTSTSDSSPLPPTAAFPPYFKKGSMIQLASGEMKKVEDLDTEDFVDSANLCHDISIEHATVARIEPVQQTGLFLLSFSVGKSGKEVTISTNPEHPFFVHGHGWSSCSPSLSMTRYSLSTHQLAVGNTCISLTQHVGTSSESALMPPPHTSPETAKEYKQVRFQESPTPKKRKHDSSGTSSTLSETPPPVLVRVRVSHACPSPQGGQRQGEDGRYSPFSTIIMGDKKCQEESI